MNTNGNKYLSLLIRCNLACVDTGCWTNGHGHGCASYAKQWCQNGAANSGSEWTLGSTYNYPEKNCCVCGKESTQGNVIPFSRCTAQ